MVLLITLIRRWQNWLMAICLIFSFCFTMRFIPHEHLSHKFLLSTALYDKNNELLRLTLANDERYRLWTPLNEISSTLIDGVLLYEDQWFYYHVGFNPLSLIRGGWKSYVSNTSRQGGSTITMQLARMYWKLNTRTIHGKIVQILRAIQLELFYSKDAILEAYFNYAPYGRNIESIGAASLIYFNKIPRQLTLQEALTLAVLPQSPAYRIDKSSGVVEKGLEKARNRLFELWQTKHPTNTFDAALFKLPLVLKQPEDLPFLAPHFTNYLLQDHKQKANHQQTIITTLDLNLQELIENQITRYIERNAIKGIHNASALLVDTRTMHITALVGSANYHNVSIQGQVDGTRSKRSPGSTLKPFIYALGFDQGLIHPMSILKDVPTAFGSYVPENFDLQFKGPITVTDALIYSRNIPAVTIASKLQQPSLYQFLRQSGIGQMANEGHYGLALSLGGGEVTMQELAQLYAMLANEGLLKPLIGEMAQTTTPHQNLRLLSPEASFMTLDMLSQNLRPNQSLSEKKSNIAIQWKTGTSWGFRDAWSVGVFGPYVLAVWVGNFNGKGNQAFTGHEAAAPLFFNIIDNILAQYPNFQEPKKAFPSNLIKVDICLASGNLVTQWCQQKGTTWFIPGKTPIHVDTIFRPVPIDIKSGKVACPPYEKEAVRIEVAEFWSSDLLSLFNQAGIPKKAPPSTEHCTKNNTTYVNEENIHIVSPTENVTYTLNRSKLSTQFIALSATVNADIKTVYWFANDAYLGKSPATKPFEWHPKQKGYYTVRAIDDQGNAEQKRIKVAILH